MTNNQPEVMPEVNPEAQPKPAVCRHDYILFNPGDYYSNPDIRSMIEEMLDE